MANETLNNTARNESSYLNETSFVNQTNPEVFEIKPRPGGYVPIKTVDLKPAALKMTHEMVEKPSRDFRIQTALDESTSIPSLEPAIPNPLNDSVYMLGVTISNLIMMATNKSDIPEDYCDWTVKYLECIRDDFGNHPPNVQGILNHIHYLQSGGTVSGPSQAPAPPIQEEAPAETPEDEEQTVRSTTKVRLSQQEA